MIEKKLIHFDFDSDYQNRKENVKDISIVFVDDSRKIVTHGTEYQFQSWGIIGLNLNVEINNGYGLLSEQQNPDLWDYLTLFNDWTSIPSGFALTVNGLPVTDVNYNLLDENYPMIQMVLGHGQGELCNYQGTKEFYVVIY